MAQPCKVFSYTNVGTEKGVLANIASAAQAGGWTVDKNAVDADGELYLHSAGGGNRRLFFSGRARQYGVRRFRGMGRAAGPVHRKAGARLLLADDRETHLAQDSGEIQHHVHGLVDPAAGRRTDRAGLPDIRHDGDAGGLHVFRRGQYAVFGLGASDVRSGGRLRCRAWDAAGHCGAGIPGRRTGMSSALRRT